MHGTDLQISTAVELEIGTAPEDESRRMHLFRVMRQEKDDAFKRDKLKRRMQHEINAEGNILKDGTVVRYMAYVLGAAMACLVAFVVRDLDTSDPLTNRKRAATGNDSVSQVQSWSGSSALKEE